MSSIPKSLSECAKIDGARDYSIAFHIYIPLSLPVIATIVVFYGLAYWNNWFNAIMLIDSPNLYPLQYLLFKLQSEIQMLKDLQYVSLDVEPPSESLKMATVVMTVGPIFLLYPFLQKYFVKGIIIGAVKG
jgi:putative aldouronate transport system permease protein